MLIEKIKKKNVPQLPLFQEKQKFILLSNMYLIHRHGFNLNDKKAPIPPYNSD